MTDLPDFTPPLWLRSSKVQTALASSKLRLLYCRGFDKRSEKLILDTGDGLRTSCYINRHPSPKGIIILMHGWMGRPQSTYVLSAAKTLFDNGFSTARVTLPDHGDAAILNREMVPITRDTFLCGAVRQICDLDPSLPVGLMGFSMGGNCVLRVARETAQDEIPQLRHVVAVSPVIEPEETCILIDKSPLIRRYFLYKFDRLFRRKQAAFPEYDAASDLLHQKSLYRLTELSVLRWGEFSNTDMYFNTYKINPADFVHGTRAITLVTAEDDPIVSANSARALEDGPGFERIFTTYGGHNGFFKRFANKIYSEQIAIDRFSTAMARA